MSSSVNPNSNHYDDFLENEEKEVDDDLDELDEYDDLDDDDSNKNNNSKLSKEQFKAKMLKMFGIIIVLFILLMVIIYLMSLINGKKHSYSEVESIMKDAAINYFNDNSDKLPSSSNSNVEITDNVLSEDGYMKSLDKYLNVSCTGKVVVKKVASKQYSYTSYLDCGDSYKTQELYKKIVSSSNIVTSGYGLYAMNGEYVYRGKDVNNYVRFSDSEIKWRIVKVTANKEIVLIQDSPTRNLYNWDDRYNSAYSDKTGINVFENSEISSHLNILYSGNYGNKDDDDYYRKYIDYNDEKIILTSADKKKLVKYNSCVGPRSENDTSKDGSSECSVTKELKFGLLPVYDFLNASLDPECTSTLSETCQNYNYLNDNTSFWLANGKSEDSRKVYFSYGSIGTKVAYSTKKIKAVIHVGNDLMIESGKGTSKSPYVIR